MSSNSIGQTIKALLDGRPETWLAKEAGFDKSSLNRVIQGTRELTISELLSVAEAFGKSPWEILRLPPPSNAIPPEIQAIIDASVKAAVAAALAERTKKEEALNLIIEAKDAEIGRLETHIETIQKMSRHKKDRAVDPHDEIRKGYAAELLEAEKLVESQSDSSSSSSSSESVKRK